MLSEVLLLMVGTALAEGPLAIPVDAGPPPAPAPAPVDLALLKEYQREHLSRTTFTTTEVYSAVGWSRGPFTAVVPLSRMVHTWAVVDGAGYPLTGRELAEAVDDAPTLEAMQDARRRGWVWGGVLAGAGTVAVASSFQAANEDRPEASTLLTLGVAGIVTGVVLPSALRGREQSVNNWYTPEEADRHIDAYNAGLRAAMGLSEADVVQIELSRP